MSPRGKTRNPPPNSNRKGPDAAKHVVPDVSGKPARTYVGVIHGIGAKSSSAWADRSVKPLSDWMTAAHFDVIGRLQCGKETCTLAEGHQHLSVRGGAAQIDIEPIYWRSTVAVVSRWRISAWSLRTVLSVGALHMVAAMSRTVHATSKLKSFGANDSGRLLSRSAHFYLDILRVVWSTLYFIFTLLVRGLAVIAGMVLLPLLVQIPQIRQLLSDPLAWTNDEESRAGILDHVNGRVEAAYLRGYRNYVIIGHSQGGSIATRLHSAWPHKKDPLTVVTLGTGDGILGFVRATRSTISTPVTAFVFILYSLFVIFSTLVLIAPTYALLRLAFEGVAGAVTAGGAVWQYGYNHAAAAATLARLDAQSGSGLTSALTNSTYLPLLPTTILGVMGALAIISTIALVKPVIPKIVDEVTTDAPGFDLIALHDPVSSPLVVLLPDSHRLRTRVITQLDSALTDHTTYFANAVGVLSGLCNYLLSLSDGSPMPPCQADLDSTSTILRSQIVSHRWLRGLAIALSLPLIYQLSRSFTAWLPSLLLSLTFCATVAAVSIRRRRALLIHNSAMVGLANGNYLRVLSEFRRRRRSPVFALLYVLLSLPLIGASVPNIAASGNAAVRNVVGLAGLVGVLMVATAWAVAIGSTAAGPTGTLAALAASVLWLVQGNAYAASLSGIYLVIGVIYSVRALKRADPLPPGT